MEAGTAVPISAARVCSVVIQVTRETKCTFPHCPGKHMEGWVGRVWEGKEGFHAESAQGLSPDEKQGFRATNRINCEGWLHRDNSPFHF